MRDKPNFSLVGFQLVISAASIIWQTTFAAAQPMFDRAGDATVKALNALSVNAAATVNGISLGTIANQAANAVPVSGGQLTGPLTGQINLGTSSNTFGLGAVITANGSGVNGPRTAQTGATFEAFKANWGETTVSPGVGEVDGVSILTRQGGVGSDSSGILVNVQNTGLGFLSMTEMVSSAIDTSTYQIKDGIDIQEGVIDELANNKIGTVYNMTYGVGSNAILIQNNPNAYWQNLIRYTKDGNLIFNVDGAGIISATGLNISSTETHAGNETHTGQAIFAVSTQTARPVTSQQSAYTFQASDCGTIVRDTAATSHVDIIPVGLPTGCTVDFIETAPNAATTFSTAGGMMIEQLGAGALSHATIGQFSHISIFVDSPMTVLLQGDIK